MAMKKNYKNNKGYKSKHKTVTEIFLKKEKSKQETRKKLKYKNMCKEDKQKLKEYGKH